MDERLTHTVPADLDGERLDRVVSVLGGMSRGSGKRLVEDGLVVVGERAGRPRDRVRTGDEITFPPPDEARPLVAVPVDFGVAYEDDHLVVVDKPSGLVVHPGAGENPVTLAAGILHRYPQVLGVGQEDRWGVVHRLDRDTSGLMVVALTNVAYDGLAAQVRDRTVERRYLALVDGLFEVPTGTIDAPIQRDPRRPVRRQVHPAGRPARTHYSVEEAYPETGVTLMAVRLETGRTHQIRVHFAAIDHPLVGDSLYRNRPDRIATPRMFLHSASLAFVHPVSGDQIELRSPLPDDLNQVVTRLV